MEYPNEEEDKISSSSVGMSEFETNFLSLRIGEEISHLKIKEIRKVTNPHSSNNLSGVDYKYLILSQSDEVLTVNSWVFYNSLKNAIQKHKRLPRILSLKHLAEKIYEVKVIE